MRPRILVMGISGAGKTTFINELKNYNGDFVHLNNDRVRKVITAGIGFSTEARLRQAEVMGDLVSIINESDVNVIADFICPLKEGRSIFKPTHIFWIDRKSERFPDTTAIFVPPTPDECEELYVVTESNWTESIKQIAYRLLL